MNGFVYILVCEAMPGLAKVGMTTRGPWERAQELTTSSGLPKPFTIHRAFPVLDAAKAEAACHEVLKRYRYAENREFFQADLMTIAKSAEAILEQQALIDQTVCVDRRETIQRLEIADAELGRIKELIEGGEHVQIARLQRIEAENRNLRSQIDALRRDNDKLQSQWDGVKGTLREKDLVHSNLLAHFQLAQEQAKEYADRQSFYIAGLEAENRKLRAENGKFLQQAIGSVSPVAATT
jgi:hypothetical protein